MPRAGLASPEAVAQRLVAEGVAPACAAGCAAKSALWTREVGGDVHHFFDLASITKPMTAVAIVRAGIAPHTPLGALLSEARGTPSEHVSIELLLAHRAGLEAHRSLYAPLLAGERVDTSAALREAANARRTEGAEGSPASLAPVYSDLGYILAGAALARAVGCRDAGEAIARLVLEPLGIADGAGTVRELEARGHRGPFVPTENVAWRGGRLMGAVHDENAWALTALGGSGHAGIFGTVDAVLTFGAAVLDAVERRGPFAGAEVDWLVQERPGGTLRAGFDGKSHQGSSAGASMGPRSFGHLGFVGTSLWIDPDVRTVVTLLTNRVFHGRDGIAIRSARPWAHELLWARAREMANG
jgi:CubicO group peptidase (beta-lactamase class C family)